MSKRASETRPVIGITADIVAGASPLVPRFQVGSAYARMIERAGGLPIILPPLPSVVDELLAICDGVVLTGGDDPDTARWGVPRHPKTTLLDPQRQEFELALLAALDREVAKPALGVCLGMQLMGLHGGGKLDQYLPDSLPTAALHWESRAHDVQGELGSGVVHSHHRQALTDAGSLTVIARAPDGVIEAVRLEQRPSMYLGVQWHPERTDDENLGFALFQRLVNEAGACMRDSQ